MDMNGVNALNYISGSIEQDWPARLMGVVGCLSMMFIAFLLSTNRRKISWRLVGIGVSLQVAFAFLVLKTSVGKIIFDGANSAISTILGFSRRGSEFVFGNLVNRDVPVTISQSDVLGSMAHIGATFAFTVLPTIIFFSALTAVLYHLRILQWFVRGMAFIMTKTMRASGAESFSAAANIFLGQTEAPLLVRPFLPRMTNSEITAVMTGGFATVAGGVMAAYVSILYAYFPDIAGHLLAASFMAAPASLVMAKIIVPETEVPETANAKDIKLESTDANLIDAAARGTSDGLMLALNVAAMLIAFIGLVALLDGVIGMLAATAGFANVSLAGILGYLFAPIAWLLGVPWIDAAQIGSLLGTKTVLNEMVAYLKLSQDLQAGLIHHPKSVIIATYALCGFANLSSIGIQLGGLSALAPNRRSDFAKVGLRAMVAGSLACFQTAAIAGILL